MRLIELTSDTVDAGGRGYPRPQLRRESWFSLNGEWEFAIDRAGQWHAPAQVEWRDRIRVPFSPEAPASGIGDTGLYRSCWYRNRVEIPDVLPHERLILRFGAVDY